MKTKIYRGERTEAGCRVTVTSRDGIIKPLNWRLDLRNHSPAGFEWGYGGSGPAQLALAILADCLGDKLAQDHYQDFKWAFVGGLAHESWELTSDVIRDWQRTQMEAVR